MIRWNITISENKKKKKQLNKRFNKCIRSKYMIIFKSLSSETPSALVSHDKGRWMESGGRGSGHPDVVKSNRIFYEARKGKGNQAWHWPRHPLVRWLVKENTGTNIRSPGYLQGVTELPSSYLSFHTWPHYPLVRRQIKQNMDDSITFFWITASDSPYVPRTGNRLKVFK